MCGSFAFDTPAVTEVQTRFAFVDEAQQLPRIMSARYHPHGEIPTVSRNSPNKLVVRYWSMLPPWLNDLKELKYPTFNARAETLREKPTFRSAWKNAQRCIIPATHFHEWKREYQGKKVISRQPFAISVKGQDMFAMGGLYSTWNNINCVTIITVQANHDMKDIHDRMPVILAPSDEETWLDTKTDLDTAFQLLQPYPENTLKISPAGLSV